MNPLILQLFKKLNPNSTNQNQLESKKSDQTATVIDLYLLDKLKDAEQYQLNPQLFSEELWIQSVIIESSVQKDEANFSTLNNFKKVKYAVISEQHAHIYLDQRKLQIQEEPWKFAYDKYQSTQQNDLQQISMNMRGQGTTNSQISRFSKDEYFSVQEDLSFEREEFVNRLLKNYDQFPVLLIQMSQANQQKRMISIHYSNNLITFLKLQVQSLLIQTLTQGIKEIFGAKNLDQRILFFKSLINQDLIQRGVQQKEENQMEIELLQNDGSMITCEGSINYTGTEKNYFVIFKITNILKKESGNFNQKPNQPEQKIQLDHDKYDFLQRYYPETLEKQKIDKIESYQNQNISFQNNNIYTSQNGTNQPNYKTTNLNGQMQNEDDFFDNSHNINNHNLNDNNDHNNNHNDNNHNNDENTTANNTHQNNQVKNNQVKTNQSDGSDGSGNENGNHGNSHNNRSHTNASSSTNSGSRTHSHHNHHNHHNNHHHNNHHHNNHHHNNHHHNNHHKHESENIKDNHSNYN